MSKHEHEIVFVGMVNVNRDNYLQGTVDVWRCRGCKKLFCDDKRYDEPLNPAIGFTELPEDEQWGILTCTMPKEVFMMSLGVKAGKTIDHTCRTGEKQALVVGDDLQIHGANTPPIHRIFLVKDNINKAIEAGVYKLTMK
jgi:hypothetical protein